jgi:succinylglutamic semialdehyde dehydrogenase
MKARGDFINGRFVKRRHSAGELRSVDPGDLDQVWGSFPCYAEAVNEACTAARKAAPSWGAGSAAEQRHAALVRIKAQLQNMAAPLAEQLSRETGRPRWDTQQEVRQLRREVDQVLGAGLAELAPERRPRSGCRIDYRARGVVAVLAPSSLPVATIHADVIAALAVGNTVVLKPSPLTPGLGQLYAELLDEADLPRGVFNMVQGDDEVGVKLATHDDVDVLLFSGRRRSAEQIVEDLSAAAAPPLLLARTAGRNVALVLDDANLDEAATEIAIGACLGTGQHAATTRAVLVQRRVASALTERLQRLLSDLRVGHARQRDVFMGPAASADVQARFYDHGAQLREAAQRQLVRPETSERADPGDDESPRGHYVRPGLFGIEPTQLAELLAPERCGPLLLIAELDDEEQAPELLAECPRPLVHSVFSRSSASFEALTRALRVPLTLLNAATTDWHGGLPLEPRDALGAPLPIGILTARALTTACVSVTRDSAFDETMLPPGLSLR